MAQIDASGLTFSFLAYQPYQVAHVAFAGSGPDYYSWDTGTTSPFYRITALSYSGDITASPLSGTINSINITNDTYGPGIGITGLNASLTSLIDTGDEATNHEKFWEKVLSGVTTIILPATQQLFWMMGDFVTVNAGQTLTGANDRFVGVSNAIADTLVGDAERVDANATLNGGADVFDNAFARYIYGDVGVPSPRFAVNGGTVNGGNDRISLIESGNSAPTVAMEFISGDIASNALTAFSKGGADTITLRNILSVSSVTGDLNYTYGTSTGGVDEILIETTLPGRIFTSVQSVSGDELDLYGTAKSNGGADSITLNNVNTGVVVGDFYNISDSASARGGNDTIIYRGSFAETSPAATYALDPTATVVSGDANLTFNASTFTGGNDIIRLLNVRADTVTGDVNIGEATGKFIGGNDFISVVYNRSATGNYSFGLYGDMFSGFGKDFTGGNDRLTLDVRASLPGGAISLYGDAYNLNCAPEAVIRNGDDSLTLISNAGRGGTLFGDGENARGTLQETYPPLLDLYVIDGNDTLTGGDGGDRLYGDTAYVGNGPSGGQYGGQTKQDGGKDILDGRGGNDTIYGGGGTDTVVFGLDLSVHVNLNGIAGTGQYPGEWIEAIGQGNDQLFNIENVTGSSQADIIIGNAQANVINGMAGADRMAGGAGNDTYYVDTAGDITTENANAGTDLVISTVSRTLSANIENLTLGGSANLQGNGNTLANIITGNAGNNILLGYEGSDTLNGGTGADTLVGGAATDFINPGSDAVRDVIRFAAPTESTGSQRDVVTGMDLNAEDVFDFPAVPSSIAFVNTGTLNFATINANLATAVNAALAINGAVLFDPSAGDLNIAGRSFLVVDANADGVYTANQDYVVQLINPIGTLNINDFI